MEFMKINREKMKNENMKQKIKDENNKYKMMVITKYTMKKIMKKD